MRERKKTPAATTAQSRTHGQDWEGGVLPSSGKMPPKRPAMMMAHSGDDRAVSRIASADRPIWSAFSRWSSRLDGRVVSANDGGDVKAGSVMGMTVERRRLMGRKQWSEFGRQPPR